MPRKATRIAATIDLTSTPPWDVTGLDDASQIDFVSLSAAGGKGLICYPSADGGSSFDTTTSNYRRSFQRHNLDGSSSTYTGFQLGTISSGQCFSTLHNFNIAARSFSFMRPSHMNSEPFAYAVAVNQINRTAYNALRLTTVDGLAFSAGTLYVVERRDVLAIIEDDTSLSGLSAYDVDLTGYARATFYLQGGVSPGTVSANMVPSDDGGTTDRGAGWYRRYDTNTTGTVEAAIDATGCPVTGGLSNTFIRTFGLVSNIDMSIPTVLEMAHSTNGNSQGNRSWSSLFSQVSAHDTLQFEFNTALNASTPVLTVVGVPNA